MADPGLTGLDHVIVGVRDLEAARAGWARLGFTITPRGRHIGWGTANYCIMFPGDYVELLGIVDASLYVHGLDRFVAEREGLLGLAFATDDTDAAFARFAAADIAVDPPKDLSRSLELPQGEVRPAFQLVHPVEPEAALGVKAFACRHLTRELVWQRGWLDHANGARRIATMTIAVADPSVYAERYRRLLGPEAVKDGGGTLDVALDGARLRFEPTDGGPAGMVGMAVEVDDIAVAERTLTDAGIAAARRAGGLEVGPADATGVALTFVAA